MCRTEAVPPGPASAVGRLLCERLLSRKETACFRSTPPPQDRLHAPRGKSLLKAAAFVLLTLAIVSCFGQANQKGRFDFLLYNGAKAVWRPATEPNPRYPGDTYWLRLDGTTPTYDLWRVFGIHTVLLPNDKIITWGYGIQPDHDVLGWIKGTSEPDFAYTPYLLWDHTKLIGAGSYMDVLAFSKYLYDDDEDDPKHTNIFCSGHSLLYDGKLLVSGGHLNDHIWNWCGDPLTYAKRPIVQGLPYGYVFDPSAQTWARYTGESDRLSEKRWYASHVSLSDCRTLIVGGVDTVADPANCIDPVYTTKYDIFDPLAAGSKFSVGGYYPTGNTNLGNIYPWVHLLSTGWVGYTGPYGWVYTLDSSAMSSGWRTFTPTRPTREYGCPILLPANNKDSSRSNPNYLKPQNAAQQALNQVMVFGGNNNGTVLKSTEIVLFDPDDRDSSKGNSPKPKHNPYGAPPDMLYNRKYGYSVLLPNGKVFVVGGTSTNAATTPVLPTEMYDPEASTAGTFTEMATMDTNMPQGALLPDGARMYHSSAILLPSSKVLVAGTDWLYNGSAYQNRYPSVYTPPWFFDSQGNEDPDLRPTLELTTNPQTGYGLSWEFPVTYTLPANRTIHSVVIMRPGSVTHSFDMEQRLIRLKWTPDDQPAGTILIYGPYDANIAPPGWYMLFLVDSIGSYSEARWIQILPDSMLMRPGG